MSSPAFHAKAGRLVPEPPEPTELRTTDLAIWRGERCLFEALSFTAGAGQIVLVVGINGAGKTSLLRVLAGLARATTGSATWGGIPVHALPDALRASVTYRGHHDGLKRELSVEESFRFVRTVFSSELAVDEVAGTLDLAERMPLHIRHLSAGQRRRVSLGCLRLTGARLWILDEPMTNLDARGRQLMADWIAEHADAGGTVVVATHRPDELARKGSLIVEL